MDLAACARAVWVIMEHDTRKGAPRLLENCTLPLTAVRCVTRVYTDLAVVDITPAGMVVRDMVDGLDQAELQARTGAPLDVCAGPEAAAPPPLPDADSERPDMQFIEVNGAALRCELSGGGASTVVLVHEMGGTLESWDVVAPRLAAKRRVLRYDTRGAGLSEKVRGALTFDTMADDLVALSTRSHLRQGGGRRRRGRRRHRAATRRRVIRSASPQSSPAARRSA